MIQGARCVCSSSAISECGAAKTGIIQELFVVCDLPWCLAPDKQTSSHRRPGRAHDIVLKPTPIGGIRDRPSASGPLAMTVVTPIVSPLTNPV